MKKSGLYTLYTHTHVCTPMYTQQWSSFSAPPQKKEILPFTTVCMDLKGTLLGEMSQTETNTA